MRANTASDSATGQSAGEFPPRRETALPPLPTTLKRPVRMFTARLSRRIVFWIFFSVIVIETIIFFPSLRNRERELLEQVKDLSSTKVTVLMQTLPSQMSEADFLDTAERIFIDELVVGLVFLRADGSEAGVRGERPRLSFADITGKGMDSYLDRANNRYDVSCGGGWQNGRYYLILRHNTASVQKELYDFFLRIAGLVVIISIFVTAGAMIALGPMVLTPILKLRRDLEAAGDAVSNDRPSPHFQSAGMRREDELGEVIGAFQGMFGQITDAISHRKQAQDELKKTFDQLETYSRALNKELEKGREIQQNFLPVQLPELEGWELRTYFQPARQVAGDYYDVFHLPDGRIGIVIADVCDKGVGAALFMALFRSLIRIFSGQFEINAGACPGGSLAVDMPLDSSPGADEALSAREQEALRAVVHTNNYVARNHGDLGMFATLVFGVLDPRSGQMSYINAGHDPLFVIAAQGGIRRLLEPSGPAVGFAIDATFRIARTRIEPGEILLGYTDGVPEAANREGEMFGPRRLNDLIDSRFATAEDLITAIAEEVQRHTGDAEQFDDITMLALRHRAL
ncbi:MAG: PP2C family protein-serine/threonine phosphatase [Desulfobacterales bacterium]|nr:PP2C family protein-serine/threonine phosphatase [Desulfobacterales bacterium]